MSGERQLSELERHLLNDYQHGFPLSPTPYADMAEQLGVSEQQVLDSLERLQREGLVSRVGAVFRPNRVGASTLAAMSVAEEELESVAKIINSYPHVNHNYEREHEFNLWFVATAASEAELCSVLGEMEERTSHTILALPLLEDFHIDLGFDLQWT
ncbi:Lrp/AsnC family transcriptional regulator [Thiohalophilus sp.]|uniref:Lrp/AsnC family transcriptional regulator n=1 Tax=Thiohalophilus sp. TaxID=3028392 RepID=UPI002ACEDEB6|nr:Lrp/AsnC family transcriptional regulator [Thiohalophilus sp.]MDZ7660875.1 Lrp/AsnC family transcriptional regulator [Thiohalophilus sp.]